MNGTLLVAQVRRLIRDSETAIVKGLFWSDAEIYLALNAAQDSFVNLCLQAKLYHCLSSIIRVTLPATTIDLSLLPVQDKYLHYLSAYVINGTEKRLCRIYLGAEGLGYSNTNHDYCFIEKDDVSFYSMGLPDQGIFTYFTYPNAISPAATLPSFPQDYYDVIVKHAAMILGIKESMNQRNIKLKTNIKQRLIVTPREFITHIIDKDLTIKAATPAAPQGEQQ